MDSLRIEFGEEPGAIVNIISTAWRNRLLRSGIGIGGLIGAELVLGLVTAIMLAQSLGAGGLGIYSIALAVATLAGLPVEFGLSGLIVREIAHHDSKMDHCAVKGVLIFSILVIIIMSAVIISLTVVFGDMLATRQDKTMSLILPIALAIIPLSALCNAFGAALSGMQHIVSGNVPQKILRPGVFVIALITALVLDPSWLTPARAMALQLVAAAVALAYSGIGVLRCFPRALTRAPIRIFWRSWGLSMLQLGLTNGMRLAQGQILLLMIGLFSSVENAGLLRVAQRGAGLVSLGAGISAIVVGPQCARLSAEGKHDRLQQLLTQAARIGTGMALIGLVGFGAIGHWLLANLFGTEFVAAWSALMILSAAEVARALFGLGGVLLNMLRHEKTTLFGLTISLVLSISITAALGPIWGVNGAAWGIFLGITGMSAFLWHKARRIVSLDSSALGWSVVGDSSEGRT